MEGESSTGPVPEQGGVRQNIRNLRSTVEGIPEKGVEAANVAVEKSRRPAALLGRSGLGVLGVIALGLALVLYFSLSNDQGVCAATMGWWDSLTCEAGTLGLIVLSVLVAAISLPGAALGIKGRRGAKALLLNAPFLLLSLIGLGLLFANLGPLGAMLQHEDAGGFILAVIALAAGLPVAAVLTWRQLMFAQEQPDTSEGEDPEPAKPAPTP